MPKRFQVRDNAEIKLVLIIMPSNNSKSIVHYWAGLYGNLGHLYSPEGWRDPVQWLPYALDNGAFTAYMSGGGGGTNQLFYLCARKQSEQN